MFSISNNYSRSEFSSDFLTSPVKNRYSSLPEHRLDQRCRLLKVAHLIISLFKEVKYFLTVLYYRLTSFAAKFSLKVVNWNPNSQGLVVLVHGLHNRPEAWFSQLSLLSEHNEIDILAPSVPKRGVCSLDEAAPPLLPKIADYARKNPNKPICLLGTSNGGRIVTWLETELRQISPKTPVKVSSVAGVHFGSSQMDFLNALGLARWLYPDALRQELRYGSEKAKELLDRVKSPLPPNCAERSYEFYATTEDLSIPNLNSTLPELNMGEKYHLLHGVGHSSIVSAVARQQITSCVEWIESLGKSPNR